MSARFSLQRFHKKRCLQVNNLPRDVTLAEIEELLSEYHVEMINLKSGPGASEALVTLRCPEVLEGWDADRLFLLRQQVVSIKPTATEGWLCVAHLPLDFSEDQFHTLVKEYGQVESSFIMFTEKTWTSKGYGLVKYTSRNVSHQAKLELDKKHIGNNALVCDWLDSKVVKFRSLHSKCLYVDCLPKGFRNLDEFRRVFSLFAEPVYCPLAVAKGCFENWGLVEYQRWEDAEETFVFHQKHRLLGGETRIQFCIPAVTGSQLWMDNISDNNKTTSLLGPIPKGPPPVIPHRLSLSKPIIPPPILTPASALSPSIVQEQHPGTPSTFLDSLLASTIYPLLPQKKYPGTPSKASTAAPSQLKEQYFDTPSSTFLDPSQILSPASTPYSPLPQGQYPGTPSKASTAAPSQLEEQYFGTPSSTLPDPSQTLSPASTPYPPLPQGQYHGTPSQASIPAPSQLKEQYFGTLSSTFPDPSQILSPASTPYPPLPQGEYSGTPSHASTPSQPQKPHLWTPMTFPRPLQSIPRPPFYLPFPPPLQEHMFLPSITPSTLSVPVPASIHPFATNWDFPWLPPFSPCQNIEMNPTLAFLPLIVHMSPSTAPNNQKRQQSPPPEHLNGGNFNPKKRKF